MAVVLAPLAVILLGMTIAIPRRCSKTAIERHVAYGADMSPLWDRYKGKSKWYPGSIAKVHNDGTVDIE